MAGSTYKCIRVKNIKKPLRSRCGKPLHKNGILCNKCFNEAHRGKIPVLMCNDVSKLFNIKFHNQVYVYIDLSKNAKKPDSQSKVDFTSAEFKKKMFHELKFMNLSELESFCIDIGITKSELKDIRHISGKDEYRIRYFMSKAIVDRISDVGSPKKDKT